MRVKLDRDKLAKARERLLSAAAQIDNALAARVPRAAYSELDDALDDATAGQALIAREQDALWTHYHEDELS